LCSTILFSETCLKDSGNQQREAALTITLKAALLEGTGLQSIAGMSFSLLWKEVCHFCISLGIVQAIHSVTFVSWKQINGMGQKSFNMLSLCYSCTESMRGLVNLVVEAVS